MLFGELELNQYGSPVTESYFNIQRILATFLER